MKRHKHARRCAGCFVSFEKGGLLRVSARKDGGIFFDETGKSGGRGAYVCKNAECVRLCVKKRGLERAFKSPVPADVYERLTKAAESG